jgi:hypothetical protein
MKHIKIFTGILLLATILGCVDSFMPKINSSSESLLVVEGRITNETGPFRIRLSHTVSIGDLDSVKPVLKANVKISDDQGHSYKLVDSGKGYYETPEKNLVGIPGYKYTLVITTPDSVKYSSSTVTMLESPAIDSLYYEEVKHTRIQENQTYEDTWMNILVDTHDDKNGVQNYLYDFQETWEVNLLANPIILHHSERPENYERVFVRSDDTKKICWVTKNSNTLVIANTAKNTLNELNHFPVQQIGPYESKLHVRYSILVRQYALPEELYTYFKDLQDVNINTGGLYEKIPAPVFGNITSADGKKAVGYFMASTVSTKRIFILRSEHHLETVNQNSDCYYFDYNLANSQKYLLGYQVLSGGKVYGTTEGCTDCTLYGTNVKPSFW